MQIDFSTAVTIAMDCSCCSFSPLVYSLFWSGGVSSWHAALSNLACKLGPDVRIFWLSCKNLVGKPQLLTTFTFRLHSTFLSGQCNAIPQMLRSIILIDLNVIYISFGVFSPICVHNSFNTVLVSSKLS